MVDHRLDKNEIKLMCSFVPFHLAVYLRADPEICFERIKKRSRKEECCVPFVSTNVTQKLSYTAVQF